MSDKPLSQEDIEILDELFTIGNLTDEQFRQVKRLRAENEQWQETIKQYREEIDREHAEVERERQYRGDLEATYTDVLADRNELRAENERLRATGERQRDAYERQIANLADRIVLQTENERLQRENGALARMLALVEKTLRERTSQLHLADAENERLRINLRDYRQKHPCSHEIMCWADEVASKALDNPKARPNLISEGAENPSGERRA